MASMPIPKNLPRTLGELRRSRFSEERLARRTVKDEIRENLICRLQRKEPLFPGVVGYEETVAPQVVNAHSLQAQLHPAWIARTGENEADPAADHPAR